MWKHLHIVVLLLTILWQNAVSQTIEDILTSPTVPEGNEFIVAWPLNNGSAGASSPDLEVYISTRFPEANVEVIFSGDNSRRRFRVVKNTVTTMSTSKTGSLALSAAYEITHAECELAVPKGLIISSDVPISVYVINSKIVSTDGYMAIPTHVWGTEYRPIAYFDFNDINSRYSWAGGFCVVASEDSTDVTITLAGKGQSLASTVRGRSIGDRFTVQLNRGECYMVMGNGSTRNVFDLTGSHISSSKPIGVLGFHSRTALPNATLLEGRDHLVEMIPPTSAWGTSYTTIELKRQSANGKGRGDYYRILAAEDSTVITGHYLDKETKAKISDLNIDRLDAGEFSDFFGSATTPSELPYGIVQFSGNKPFLVMQYSTSASWDGDTQHDPFMMLVAPTSTFGSSGTIQTPSLDNFNIHYLNIIATTTDSATAEADLQSITLNDEPVWSSDRVVDGGLLNEAGIIPASIHGQDIRFVTLHCRNGESLTIRSNGKVRLGGYLFGFGIFDSYGYPAALALADSSQSDTTRPDISAIVDSTSARFSATKPNMASRRSASLARVRTLPGTTNANVTANAPLLRLLPRTDNVRIVEGVTTMEDTLQDCVVILAAQDYAGNVAIDTILIPARPFNQGPDTNTTSLSERGLASSVARIVRVHASDGVELDVTRSGTMELWTLEGSRVFNTDVAPGNTFIRTSTLPSGVYVIRFAGTAWSSTIVVRH